MSGQSDWTTQAIRRPDCLERDRPGCRGRQNLGGPGAERHREERLAETPGRTPKTRCGFDSNLRSPDPGSKTTGTERRPQEDWIPVSAGRPVRLNDCGRECGISIDAAYRIDRIRAPDQSPGAVDGCRTGIR